VNSRTGVPPVSSEFGVQRQKADCASTPLSALSVAEGQIADSGLRATDNESRVTSNYSLATQHSLLATDRGFTLLELILVIGILSIFAALAIPTFTDAYADYKVESAANRIAADIRYARSYAIKIADTINVVFDTVNEKYEVRDSIGQIKHPFSKKNFQITMTNEFDLEGIDLYQVTIPGGGQSLGFDSLGTTTFSGTATIKVRYAGREKTVAVSSIDGEASVS